MKVLLSFFRKRECRRDKTRKCYIANLSKQCFAYGIGRSFPLLLVPLAIDSIRKFRRPFERQSSSDWLRLSSSDSNLASSLALRNIFAPVFAIRSRTCLMFGIGQPMDFVLRFNARKSRQNLHFPLGFLVNNT